MPPRDIEALEARWTGRTLDRRYRLDRVVGRGGFGLVIAGRHLTLDVPIAVKVLHVTPEVVGVERHADVLASFIEEARIVARLRHPNIVTVLDCGVTGGDPAASGTDDAGDRTSALPPSVPWIVMDWCDGTPLDVDLDARRGLGGRSVEETWRLLGPIVEAVAYAHERGVVHRDIKPSNVMLDHGPAGRITPRLLDFGIAKHVEPGEAAGSGVTATQSTWRTFTPAYAAIEQRLGGRTGPWTDVYALALLLVEVLTDAEPHGADDPAVAAVSAERPTPAARGVDAGAWEHVLKRALAVRPADRHANAGELFAALEAALPGRPSRSTDMASPLPREPVIVSVGRSPRLVAADAETDAAPVRADTERAAATGTEDSRAPAPGLPTSKLPVSKPPASRALVARVAVLVAAALALAGGTWGLSRLAADDAQASPSAAPEGPPATPLSSSSPPAGSPTVPTGAPSSTTVASSTPVVVTPTTATAMSVASSPSTSTSHEGPRPGPGPGPILAGPRQIATTSATGLPRPAHPGPSSLPTTKPSLY